MVSGLKNIETIESPFRRFVTTIGVFPTAFTDAMTYYECLAYLVKYIEDTVVPAVNENAEALKELQKYYVQLKSYVENYFDNLDIQEEINNKLDQMAEAGTLQEIITAYIQANVAWTFDTVADMKQATNLVNGSYARTLGFHTLNDGGGALYKITNTGTANEMNVIAVGSLFANLVINPQELNVKQFGAYGDGTHDDLTAIQYAIDYGRANDYFKIYFPEGRYIVSNAVVIYELMHVYGATRDTSAIVKNTNATDTTDNVDAVVIFRKSADYAGSYTERQQIKDITIEGKTDNTYGIYSSTSCPRSEINNCTISKVTTGVKLASGWLFSIIDVSVGAVTNGFDIGANSTSLNMTNTYVYGGSGIAYKLRGVEYSGLTNVCCDKNTGTPYRFEYCNLTINGFGCECDEASIAIYSEHGNVTINSGTIIVNPTDSSYRCVQVSSGKVTLNSVKILNQDGEHDTTAGMLLYTGTLGDAEFNSCKLDKPFATANRYYDNYGTQKVSTDYADFIDTGGNKICGVGNVANALTKENDFAEKSNTNQHMGGVFFNNKAQVRYALDGTDRNWFPSYKLGDIFVNQAPALNGIAMMQQTSDPTPTAMTGTIQSVSISGTTGSIVMTSLDLATASLGLKIENSMKITSSSGGTGTISSIDEGNATISLTGISGSFNVGDSVTYTGRTRIGLTTYANIQSIGYGTTANRPSSPVNGYMYFDTTLGKPIWRSGGNWKDATGSNV